MDRKLLIEWDIHMCRDIEPATLVRHRHVQPNRDMGRKFEGHFCGNIGIDTVVNIDSVFIRTSNAIDAVGTIATSSDSRRPKVSDAKYQIGELGEPLDIFAEMPVLFDRKNDVRADVLLVNSCVRVLEGEKTRSESSN